MNTATEPRTGRTLTDLRLGDHPICLYENEQEKMDVLSILTRQGVDQREKIFCVIDEAGQDALIRALEAKGMSVSPVLKSGQLSFLSPSATTHRHDSPDPQSLLAFYETASYRASAQGFTGLRVLAVMDAFIPAYTDGQRLVTFEAMLNTAAFSKKSLLVCLYRKMSTKPALLLEAIKTHSWIVTGGVLVANPFHLPPDVFLSVSRAEAEFAHAVQTLTATGTDGNVEAAESATPGEASQSTRDRRMLVDCARVLIRAADEKTLLRDVARIMVGTGQYRLVWVGFAEADRPGPWQVAEVQGSEERYLDSRRTDPAEAGKSETPEDSAFQTGRTVIFGDLRREGGGAWRGEAVKRGYLSCAALPLAFQGRVFGVLAAYSAEPGRFGDAETHLLAELAGNMAFEIQARRARLTQEQSERRLRESEARYRSLFAAMKEGVALHEIIRDAAGKPSDYRIVDVNPAYESITGLSRDALLGKPASLLYGAGQPPYLEEFVRVAESGTSLAFETHVAPTGRHFQISIFSPERDRFATVFTDITARKEAESRGHRTRRALQALNPCHAALLRARDGKQLLADVCAILLEHGGYRLAWAGLAEQDSSRPILPVAQAGFEPGFLSTLRVSWSEKGSGEGPMGSAIRTGAPVVARRIPDDPAFASWREQAERRGYAAVAFLPLTAAGHTLGALAVYAKEPDSFDSEETALLQQLAGDVAFSLVALNARADRDRTEQRLLLREWALETAIQPMAFADPEGRILYANPAFLRLFECTREEDVLDKPLASLAVRPEPVADILRQLRETDQARGELQGRQKNGALFDLEVEAVAVRDERGIPIRVFASFTNATAYKQASQALADREARYRGLVEQVPVTLYSALPDERLALAYVSPRIRDLLGCEPDPFIADPEARFARIHHEERESVRQAMRHALAGNRGYTLDYRMLRETGETVWVRDAAEPVFDRNGRIVLLQGMLTDITPFRTDLLALEQERNALAQKEEQRTSELRLARDVAESASRTKSSFLAGMSHELRTPLNAVIGFSEVLLEPSFGPLNPKQAEFVNHILESGTHLQGLIDDILTISRIESGKMDLKLAPVPLKELLEQSVGMFKEKCRKADQELQLIVTESALELSLLTDAGKLKQVLFNLISNAVKFTPHGGSVLVTARKIESEDTASRKPVFPPPYEPTRILDRHPPVPLPCVEIAVSDSGAGVEPEFHESVFTEFFQIRTGPGNKPDGTGLGLALTRRFVNMHGGQVWVESAGRNKGSRFVCALPVHRQDQT